MPNAIIKSIANKAGVKKSKVEARWNDLKKEYGENYKAIVGTLEKEFKLDDVIQDSNRTTTAFGHLKIENCILTAEEISPYLGSELPDFPGRVLDKIYQVYRPLSEIKKSLYTYNDLPLTDEHYFVDFNNANKDKWLGSISGHAIIKDGKVYNTIAIWDKKEVMKQLSLADNIDNEEFRMAVQNKVNARFKEKPRDGLSCGYGFTLVPESGVFNGAAYDLKMTDITCNHVALVGQPRVKVAKLADSIIFLQGDKMKKNKLIKYLQDNEPEVLKKALDNLKLIDEEKEVIEKKTKDKKGKDTNAHREKTGAGESTKDKKGKDTNAHREKTGAGESTDDKKGKDKSMTKDDINALIEAKVIDRLKDHAQARMLCEKAIGKTTFAADAEPEEMINATLKALNVDIKGKSIDAKKAILEYASNNKQAKLVKTVASDSVKSISKFEFVNI